jgi:FtsZ-binding cell division protein ZapB
VDNIVDFDSGKQSKGKLLNWLSIVLIVLFVGLGIYIVFQHKQYEEKIVELKEVTMEKESLTFQYQDLLEGYNDLETSNDTLNAQLAKEQERVKEVMQQLRRVKANNRAEVAKYKNELSTLRKIMRGFIHQIDSLNTLNIQLTAENQEIKQKYQKEKTKVRELTKDFEEASEKVNKASVLKAVDISMIAYNHKGKKQKKAKKTSKFGINFTLDENVIAKQGEKNLFIRITDPNDLVLMEEEGNMMSFEGDRIAFSALRVIGYDGNKTPASVYFAYTGEEELPGGTYKVDIFCEGSMIGGSELYLK